MGRFVTGGSEVKVGIWEKSISSFCGSGEGAIGDTSAVPRLSRLDGIARGEARGAEMGGDGRPSSGTSSMVGWYV